MFKFSKLVPEICKGIKLEELYQCQYARYKLLGYPVEASSTKTTKKRKSNKQKTTSKKKFAAMEPGTSADVQNELRSRFSRSPSNSRNSNGQYVQLDRRFENVHFSPKTEDRAEGANGQQFVFMSYNILAQDLLNSHSQLYKWSKSLHLGWNFRLEKLSAEILSIRPDILCLQEVQQDHIPQIKNALKSGGTDYGFIYKKKTGFQSDGCAILYNMDMFDLLERHSVEYYQPEIKYLDRMNVGVIAKLCLKAQPSSCFITSTTHLLYNPRRQDVRLAQIQLLLAELDQISFNGFDSDGKVRRHPIILSGDFNLKPHSAPYNLITSGNLAYSNLTERSLEPAPHQNAPLTGNQFLPPHLGINDNCQHYDVVRRNYRGQAWIQNTDKNRSLDDSGTNNQETSSASNDPHNVFSTGELKHSLNLVSVYDHTHRDEATTYQEEWTTVDYIFYSQLFSPCTTSQCDGFLKLLARSALPSKKHCYKTNLVIPNEYIGSDHLSLAAKFYFQGSQSDEKESGIGTKL